VHNVKLEDTTRWSGLIDLVNGVNGAPPRGYIISEGDARAYGVGTYRWVKKIGIKTDTALLERYDPALPIGAPKGMPQAAINLITDINSAFTAGAWYVIVDELAGISADLIATVAYTLGLPQYKPSYQHRWGVYIVHGPLVGYSSLDDPDNLDSREGGAITDLLKANARLLPEFYPYLWKNADLMCDCQIYNYWRSSSTSDGARDAWLGQFFSGAAPDVNVPPDIRPATNRLNWLMARRATLGSASIVQPVFGAIDKFLKCGTTSNDTAMRFLDRMFYVYKTRTSYPSLIHDDNDGGVGSWKWEDATSPMSRDEGFADSYVHYSVNHLSSSRTGPVPAP
jgi:hypothetical protein